MTDAKKFSFDFAETLAERKIDEFERVIDECVGVQPIGHGDGGQRIGILCGIARKKFKIHRFNGAATGFGQPRMAVKNIVETFFEEHFETLAQAE